ncbi:glucose-methanol-choline oxidoreductase [Microbacterium sp. Root61]|uniref:GMC family oxidoreductase n=1 Tax=Microbacterium sp. Root61 TaxID=1736570 RepID=UPI0006F3CA09|nr:FAD-dependent oxidoreductase [Microbacterium sp. Root61]KRA24760.1 glucose-methanol-choline oxidoreductase [Microbacterium sp. Root61]
MTNTDIVVVGAGSAGAAIASRCAQAGMSVLLIEAGRDERSADLPAEWRSPNPVHGLLSESRHDYLWNDLVASRTEAQESFLYWRGRGLGGSSVVNGQIAIRPSERDFEEWAALGCDGWSWPDVLPYFRRLEDDLEYGSDVAHGSGGPIPIYRAPLSEWGAVDTALRLAALQAGFPWAPDVNAPGATGVSPYPINSRDLLRVTANDGYLEPVRALPNLRIIADSIVDRVVFDGDRATGVVLANGDRHSADQVVLAGGVIGSPSILMRSGIGPEAVLRRAGVAQRSELPVGQGMQDHPLILIHVPLRDGLKAGPEDRHTNCCVRYSSGDPGLENDMMLVSLNQNMLGMSAADAGAGAGAIGVWVNRVFSRGSVEIVSADPTVDPTVRENMLSDEAGSDLARLRDGVRLLRDLADHPSFAEIVDGDLWAANTELREALAGGDRQLDAHLRETAGDTQHGTSTCRMGAEGDPDAVVDPRGAVYGTTGLMVADASVFPFVSTSNTHLVSVMTGERAAAQILEGVR